MELKDRLIEILCKPSYNLAMMANHQSYKLNPAIETGDLHKSDKLFLPVGQAEFSDTLNIGKGYPDFVTDIRMVTKVTGYWSLMQTNTIYLPVEFRGLVPVWKFALTGSYDEEILKNKDQDVITSCFDVLSIAHRQLWDLRRKGDQKIYFRAPAYEKDGNSYQSTWVGDWDSCVGQETISIEGRVAWRANFMAQFIIPVS